MTADDGSGKNNGFFSSLVFVSTTDARVGVRSSHAMPCAQVQQSALCTTHAFTPQSMHAWPHTTQLYANDTPPADIFHLLFYSHVQIKWDYYCSLWGLHVFFVWDIESTRNLLNRPYWFRRKTKSDGDRCVENMFSWHVQLATHSW